MNEERILEMVGWEKFTELLEVEKNGSVLWTGEKNVFGEGRGSHLEGLMGEYVCFCDADFYG